MYNDISYYSHNFDAEDNSELLLPNNLRRTQAAYIIFQAALAISTDGRLGNYFTGFWNSSNQIDANFERECKRNPDSLIRWASQWLED